MSVEERCGVVVGGEVRDGHCFDFDFKLDVLINKHGRYDRLLARLSRTRCSWPQLYLLASALSIFSRLGDSSLGVCYICLPV